MQFNSYSYIFALTLVVALFWLMPQRYRRLFVLIVSIAFYASWNIYLVVVPLMICVCAFATARLMSREDQKEKYLGLGIAVILLVLAYFKYSTFAFNTLSGILGGIDVRWKLLFIGLPLGISFYSFEAISYLLDTGQGRVAAKSFLDLCLFVMFWPHLIAGPIVRSRELMPQLNFVGGFKLEYLTRGLDRFVLGLVQKNLFANSLAGWIDSGFLISAAATNTTIDNWALALAFGLQIYFDFSAYSNMAIGAAQMIGIRLPENFRHPYHSATPAEFWTRWHMTLSRWIRDYLFFPLGVRFKDSRAMLYVSLIGVMALVGLWHGAGWGFIVWGILHGLYLVAHRYYESCAQGYAWLQSRITKMVLRLTTLAAVFAAWIPFRASTLTQTASMLSSMFLRLHFGISYSVNFYLVTFLIALICVVEPYLDMCASRLTEKLEQDNSWRRQMLTYVVRPAAYAFGLMLFMAFDDQDTTFIYFQF